jgi:hypothetical protein
MKAKIKGITIYRPWGYAIAHLGKDIENRNWECNLNPGDFLAIHNGQKYDEDAMEFIENMNPLLMNFKTILNMEKSPAGAIVAVARFNGNLRASDSPWFTGAIGWKLDSVVSIDPVECRGQQGLWDLPPDVITMVRREYLKALNVD